MNETTTSTLDGLKHAVGAFESLNAKFVACVDDMSGELDPERRELVRRLGTQYIGTLTQFAALALSVSNLSMQLADLIWAHTPPSPPSEQAGASANEL